MSIPRILRITKSPGDNTTPDWAFWCPGCKCGHAIHTTLPAKNGSVWKLTGPEDSPTITPSWLHVQEKMATTPRRVCHLVVTNGVLNFLSDCTHELVGKSVPMEPF